VTLFRVMIRRWKRRRPVLFGRAAWRPLAGTVPVADISTLVRQRTVHSESGEGSGLFPRHC
jgi:hypothetical protein